MEKRSIKLSELPDDAFVYQEDEFVRTVKDLRKEILNGWETRTNGWILGIPQVWTPNVEYMLESYIDTESDDLYEDAFDDMWEKVQPLIPQIQSMLDSVEISYYLPGGNVEIDISPLPQVIER